MFQTQDSTSSDRRRPRWSAKMAARAEKNDLNLILVSHLNTIHETLQVLDLTPSSSSSFANKVTWDDVIKMSEQVSKQATTGLYSFSYYLLSFFLLFFSS